MLIVKHLLPLFTLFSVLTSFSQDGQNQQNTASDYRKMVVFFNSLNALEPDIPIAVTFQQRLDKKYAVALDLGMYVAGNYGLPAGGFRIKPEFKFYFPERYRANNASATYLSFQLLIKHISFDEAKRVGRQCNNGQCAYFQTIDYELVKNVYGGNVILGKESFLGKKQKFYIGMYIGFGIRYKHFFDKGLPDDVLPTNFDATESFGIITIIKNGWYPSFPMGINIGWRIK